MPCRLNPHRSQTLPAVSFFEGFQTPAGPEKTRAHSCGRHLKPITQADVSVFSRSHACQGRLWDPNPVFFEKPKTIPPLTQRRPQLKVGWSATLPPGK